MALRPGIESHLAEVVEVPHVVDGPQVFFGHEFHEAFIVGYCSCTDFRAGSPIRVWKPLPDLQSG